MPYTRPGREKSQHRVVSSALGFTRVIAFGAHRKQDILPMELPLTNRERSFALRKSDGKVCPRSSHQAWRQGMPELGDCRLRWAHEIDAVAPKEQ
jgi:hypothetical protein